MADITVPTPDGDWRQERDEAVALARQLVFETQGAWEHLADGLLHAIESLPPDHPVRSEFTGRLWEALEAEGVLNADNQTGEAA
jgi:hypothetical protein